MIRHVLSMPQSSQFKRHDSMIQFALLAVMTLSVACFGQTPGTQKAIICLTYDDDTQIPKG
jgi:hypothetical protein